MSKTLISSDSRLIKPFYVACMYVLGRTCVVVSITESLSIYIHTYIHTYIHSCICSERVFDNIERMWDLSVSCPENLVCAFEIVEMQQASSVHIYMQHVNIQYILTYIHTYIHTLSP